MSRAAEGEENLMTQGLTTQGTGNGQFNDGNQDEKRKTDGETPITTVAINAEADCMLEGRVNGVPARILADTGAAATIMSKTLWEN